MADWRAIARGGFAIVWQARQESLNRLVAVKVDERKLDSEAEQRRFLREAGAAGRMSGHPGIVTVHDAGLLGDDRPFLVMELYGSRTLCPRRTCLGCCIVTSSRPTS
jgi:serine/threonine protein kinase